MSAPLADPSRFDGFIEHLEAHAGECVGGEPPTTADNGNRGYGLVFFEDDREPATSTVASTGLRFQELTAFLEAEVVCTVLREQFGAAHHLVDFTATWMIEHGVGLNWDTVLTNGVTILARTQIQGMMATTHPYYDDEFNALRDATGKAQLRIITLIPATAAELQLANDEGEEALYARWTAQNTPLLDITRASAV